MATVRPFLNLYSIGLYFSLTLEKGVRYTQTVEKAFHMSMAALEDPGKKDGIVSVMISTVKAEFLLCSLSHKTLFNQPLDLNFTEGEEVSFFINGEGTVHLTGYQLEDDQDDFDDDYGDLMVDSDDDDEVPKLVPEKGKKRKGQTEPDKPKKMKMETKGKKPKDDDDDEFSDDDDDDDDENLDSFLDDEAELDEDIDDDEEMEDDDDDDDDDDEEEIKPQKKSAKKEKAKVQTPVSQKKKKESKEQPKTPAQEKQPTPAQTPSASGDGSESSKKKKKKKKKNKNKEGEADTPGKQDQQKAGQTPQKQGPQKKVLGGGVVMEEFNAGNGPTAQKGKMMHVYYVGKLLKDGKQFDSCTSGKPFKFRLGHKEVISGWDKGLEGMKVGGKRRLVVPPKEGYGTQRQGPIPPNSTLIFDIELKSVS